MRCRGFLDYSVKLTTFLVSQRCSISTQGKRKLSKSKHRKNQPHRKSIAPSSCTSFQVSEKIISVTSSMDYPSKSGQESPQWRKKMESSAGASLSDTFGKEINADNDLPTSQSSCNVSSWGNRIDPGSENCTHISKNDSSVKKKEIYEKKMEVNSVKPSSRLMSAYTSVSEPTAKKGSAATPLSLFASLVQKHRIMRRNYSSVNSSITVWNAFSQLCVTAARDNSPCFNTLLQSFLFESSSEVRKTNQPDDHFLTLNIHGALPACVDGSAGSSTQVPQMPTNEETIMKSTMSTSTHPLPTSSSFFSSSSRDSVPDSISTTFLTDLKDVFSTSFDLPFPSGLEKEFMEEEECIASQQRKEEKSADASVSRSMNSFSSMCCDGRWHDEWKSFILGRCYSPSRKENKDCEECNHSFCAKEAFAKQKKALEETSKSHPAATSSSVRSIFLSVEQCADLEESFGFPPVSMIMNKILMSSSKAVGSPQWQQSHDLQRQVVQEMFRLLKTISFFRWVKEEYRCRYFTLMEDEMRKEEENAKTKVVSKGKKDDENDTANPVRENENGVLRSTPGTSSTSFPACLKNLLQTLKKKSSSTSTLDSLHELSSRFHQQKDEKLLEQCTNEGEIEEWINTISEYLFLKTTEIPHDKVKKEESSEKSDVDKVIIPRFQNVHIFDLLYHLLYRYAISNFLNLNAKNRGLCFRMSLLPSSTLPLTRQFTFSFACWYALLEYEGLHALAWRIVEDGKKRSPKDPAFLTNNALGFLSFSNSRLSSSSVPYSSFPTESGDIDFSTFLSEMRIFANACAQGLSDDITLTEVINSLLKEYQKRDLNSYSHGSSRSGSTSECNKPRDGTSQEVMLASETMIMDFQRLVLTLPHRNVSSSPLFFFLPYVLSSQWWQYCHQIFDPLVRIPSLWMYDKAGVEDSGAKIEGKEEVAHSTASTFCLPLAETETKVLSPLLDACYIETITSKVKKKKERLLKASFPLGSIAHHGVASESYLPRRHHISREKEGKESVLTEQEQHQSCFNIPSTDKTKLVVLAKDHHLTSRALKASRTLVSLASAAALFTSGSLSTNAPPHPERKLSSLSGGDRAPLPHISSCLSEIPSLLRWVGIQSKSVPFFWSAMLDTVRTKITSFFVRHSPQETQVPLEMFFENIFMHRKEEELRQWEVNVGAFIRTGAFSLRNYLGRIALQSLVNDLLSLPQRWEDMMVKKNMERTEKEYFLSTGKRNFLQKSSSHFLEDEGEMESEVKAFLLYFLDLGVCGSLLCLANQPVKGMTARSTSNTDSLSEEGNHESASSIPVDPFSSLLQAANSSRLLSSTLSKPSRSSLHEAIKPPGSVSGLEEEDYRGSFSSVRNDVAKDSVNDFCFQPLSPKVYEKLVSRLSFAFFSCVQKLSFEAWASPNRSIDSLQQGMAAGKGLFWMIQHLSEVDVAIYSTSSPNSSSTPIALESSEDYSFTSSILESRDSYPCLRECFSSLQQHIFAQRISHEVLKPFLGLHENALSRVLPLLTVQFPIKESAGMKNSPSKKIIYPLSDPSFVLPQWALYLARDELKEEEPISSDVKDEHSWSQHLQWTTLQEGLISIVQKRLLKLLEGCTIVGRTASKESLVTKSATEFSSSSNSCEAASTKLFPFSFSLAELSMSDVIRTLGFTPLSIEEFCVVLRLLSRMKRRQAIYFTKNKSFSPGRNGAALNSIVDMFSECIQNENIHRSSSSGLQSTINRSENALSSLKATEPASLFCVSNSTPFIVTLSDVVVVLQSCVEEYLTLLPLACQLDAVFIGLLEVTKLPAHPLYTTFGDGSKKDCISIQKNLHTTPNSHVQLRDTFVEPRHCDEECKEGEDDVIKRRVWPVDVSLNRFNSFVASSVLMRHAPFVFARSGGWKYGEVLQNSFETPVTRGYMSVEHQLLHRDKTLFFSDPHVSMGNFLDERILHLSDVLQRILAFVVSYIVRSVAKEQKVYKNASKLSKVCTEVEKNSAHEGHSDINASSSSSSFSTKSPSMEKKSGQLDLFSSSSNHYSSSSLCDVLQCYCLTSYLYILMKELPPQASLLLFPLSKTSKADLSASERKETDAVSVLSLYSTIYCILLHIASKVVHNSRTERIFVDELLWCLAFSVRTVQDALLNVNDEGGDGQTFRKQWWNLRETTNEAADASTMMPAIKEDMTSGVGSSLLEEALDTSRHTDATAKESVEVEKSTFPPVGGTPRSLPVLFRLLPDLQQIHIPIPPVGCRHPMMEAVNENDAIHRRKQEKEEGKDGNAGASPLFCCQNFNAFYWPLMWSTLYPQVQGLIETCIARGHVKVSTNIVFGIHSLRASLAPFLEEKELQLDTMLHRAAAAVSQGNLSFVFHSSSFFHYEHQCREHTHGNEGDGLYHQMEKRMNSTVPSICSLAAASAMLPSCTRSCTLIAQQIRSSPASFSMNEVKRFLLVLRNWGEKVRNMDYQYQTPPHPTDGGGGGNDDGPPLDYHRHSQKSFSPSSLAHLREGQQVRIIRGTITHCIPPPQVRAAWGALARRLWNNEVQQYVESALLPLSGKVTRVEETALGEIVALALHTGAMLQCSDTLVFRQLLSFLLYADSNSDVSPDEKRTISASHERIFEPYCSTPDRKTSSPFSLRLLSTWTIMVQACALAVEDRQEYAILLREMFLLRLQANALLDLEGASTFHPLFSENIICNSRSEAIPQTVIQLSLFIEALGTICAADVELWEVLEKIVVNFWCVQLENSLSQDAASKAKESLLRSLWWGNRTAGFL